MDFAQSSEGGFVQSSHLHADKTLDDMLSHLSSDSEDDMGATYPIIDQAPTVSPLDKKKNAQLKREIQKNFEVLFAPLFYFSVFIAEIGPICLTYCFQLMV